MKPFSFIDVIIRLLLALVTGGILGYGRTRKQRAAGLRTYILTSLGACMAILLSQYEYAMLVTEWAPVVEEIGLKYDASRYGAQVIAGIGFLGAGTIIAAGHMQVSGLTTATGLFAVACIGMAAGAGFIEGIVVVMIPIILILDYSYPIEYNFKRRLRNMTIHVTFEEMENLSEVTRLLEESSVEIFEMDVEESDPKNGIFPSVVMSIRLSSEHPSHSNLLSSVAELPSVRSVRELIS